MRIPFTSEYRCFPQQHFRHHNVHFLSLLHSAHFLAYWLKVEIVEPTYHWKHTDSEIMSRDMDSRSKRELDEKPLFTVGWNKLYDVYVLHIRLIHARTVKSHCLSRSVSVWMPFNIQGKMFALLVFHYVREIINLSFEKFKISYKILVVVSTLVLL